MTTTIYELTAAGRIAVMLRDLPRDLVTTTARITRGAVDVRSKMALPSDDFIRVLEDDETYIVLHLTADEALRGEVRLSGSMTDFLSAIVTDLNANL